jgi:putative membrane protein
MPPHAHIASEPWVSPVWLTVAMVLAALLYMRGWLHLRSASVNVIPVWRASSFFLGLFLIWVALGSPIAALDEELLTAHMVQHLLLMTFAPPLILLGAPLMPFLHGLPQQFVQAVVGPLFRWPPVQRLGRALGRPAFCWIAATAALIGWHIPAAFTLALRSEEWHGFEHASFLATGLLFWWPVVQPWPSPPAPPRFSILLYLFLATLPCDILSGFLVFADRVAYPAYLATPRRFAFSVAEDQQCAGALMWTCVTLVYLVPAAILTMKLLAPRCAREHELVQTQSRGSAIPRRDKRSLEAV